MAGGNLLVGTKLFPGSVKPVKRDSPEVGERVINKLKEWDEVAYVRFASVYRQFKDINEFMTELEDILKSRREREK